MRSTSTRPSCRSRLASMASRSVSKQLAPDRRAAAIEREDAHGKDSFTLGGMGHTRHMTARLLQRIARQHGTPVVVIDHDIIRRNYAAFRKHLPKVQAYYAVKANPAPEIVRTLYKAGASFDVASLPEFMLVYENIKRPARQGSSRISSGTRSSTPIPTKPKETLRGAGPVQAAGHLRQPERSCRRSSSTRRTPAWCCACACPTPARWCELSTKFGCDPGEAVDLIEAAFQPGLVVEGLSFHVGSQCTNFENFVQALNMAAAVMQEAATRGHEIKILDIGGGFPAPYDQHVKPFRELARRDQRRDRPAVPAGHRDPGRAGPVPGGDRGHGRGADHRQGGARRQDLLLHRRQRLSHLLRHHLRPLPVSV